MAARYTSIRTYRYGKKNGIRIGTGLTGRSANTNEGKVPVPGTVPVPGGHSLLRLLNLALFGRLSYKGEQRAMVELILFRLGVLFSLQLFLSSSHHLHLQIQRLTALVLRRFRQKFFNRGTNGWRVPE